VVAGLIQTDLFLWLIGRITGLASFLALGVCVLSGIALRTSVLDRVGSNRAWLELHVFTSVLWMPLGAIHLVALVADRTARIGLRDLVIPFGVDYGPLAIGLGTLAFDLVAIVAVTGWLKRRMAQPAWSWIHRLSYPAFAMTVAHAVLSGTDFSAPAVSAVAWSFGFAVLVLALARVLWGRLPA
jgi:methionine sulfoxide reductase heme-binding subunit